MKILKGRYGNHNLAAAYRTQLKAKIKLISESPSELAAAVKQLAQRSLVGLPVDFIQREVAHAFVHGVRERELKQHLLMGGNISLNEAFDHSMKRRMRRPEHQRG
jgi:hypothetical protein